MYQCYLGSLFYVDDLCVRVCVFCVWIFLRVIVKIYLQTLYIRIILRRKRIYPNSVSYFYAWLSYPWDDVRNLVLMQVKLVHTSN